MKTLNSYILKNLMMTAALAFAVLTFSMFSGYFFKAIDLLYKGVSPLTMCRFLLYMLPEILRFTVPLSLLAATVLLFGRLSADNEIVAMKAVGISIWQIISPGLIFSFLLSVLCLFNALFFAPLLRYKSETLQAEALIRSPLALIEPGIFGSIVDDSWAIRVGSNRGNTLEDIHILQRDSKGKLFQDIYARKGTIRINDTEEIELELQDVDMTTADLSEKPTPAAVRFHTATKVRIPLDFKKEKNSRNLIRKRKFMDIRMLFARMALAQSRGEEITSYMVELHQRLALAISPFSFLLIGIPFAIRSKRSELSIGLLLCVLLALGFYAFLMLSDALEDVQSIHPEFILWLPNIIYQAAGIYFIRRLDRNQ